MRFVLLPLLAASSLAAADSGKVAHADPVSQPPEASMDFAPSEVELPRAVREALGFETEAEPDCGDTIMQAREDAGQPPVPEREPASPDKPHLILALDKRLDGCAVMVMKGDPADMRHLPKAAEGPLLVIPAASGR